MKMTKRNSCYPAIFIWGWYVSDYPHYFYNYKF